jgi:hypothetical protein
MLFVVTQQESSAAAAGDLHPVGAAMVAINAIAFACGGC